MLIAGIILRRVLFDIVVYYNGFTHRVYSYQVIEMPYVESALVLDAIPQKSRCAF